MFLGSFGQLTFPLSDHGAFLFTQLPRRQVSLTKRFSLFYYSTGNRGKWDWWTGGDLGGRPSGRLFAGSSVSVISTCWPPTRASIEDSWVSSNGGTSFFLCAFAGGFHSPIKSKSSPPLHALECSSLCFCCFVSLRWKHNASLCQIVDPKFPFLFFALRQG